MKKLYFRIIPTMSILFKTRLASTLATQGRRKGGAEGANAPSIFGKLHHLIPILGYVKKLATIAIVQNLVAPSILSPCAAPAT